jgi:cytoskeletal protein CcmA (bactofilin family)
MTRPSLIPGSVTVEGELTGRGDLVILGRVLGDITIDGLLIIEEGGAVRGEVRAASVVIRGALAGDAVGQESVRVEAGAQVVGDLRAPRIKVADGAQLKGRVQIGVEAGLSPVKQVAPGPRVRRARPAGLTEAMSLSAHSARVRGARGGRGARCGGRRSRGGARSLTGARGTGCGAVTPARVVHAAAPVHAPPHAGRRRAALGGWENS